MIVYDKEQKQIVIPNGIGNIDIYNNGAEAGYNQGKIDGIDEQKSKLESINITENGTYSREDGYNHIEVNVPDLNGSYDEGYNQGQAILEANARDIEVTKNGVYQSKYSDPIMPIVTGVYADDTKFYGYAELSGKVFNTRITGSVDSRLEFWYKGDNAVSRPAGYNIIIGAGDKNRVNCFQIRYYADKNDTLWVEIDGSEIKVYNWDDTVWHHLIVSRAEGLWIDGEKKGDFSPTTNTIKGEFYINGAGYDKFGNRPANGYFGMIKIDDVVIIPTVNGFKKVNGDEMLQVVKDGNYTFAENLPTYGEGGLYKTINVNIDVDSYYNNGYNQGKTDGIREQRLKLESINITDNGTYYKEDGYREVVVNVPDLNGSYDEGYAQGQADVAASARVLNVTENGVYKSKFSDPIVPEIVTGVYTDGTNFYSYAELNGKVFNTKIAATIDSRLEFWYKGDNTSVGFGDNVIIGAGNNDDNNCFQARYHSGFNGWVKISVGNSTIDIDNWNESVWHHLIISKAEGLWIDGDKKGDFTPSNTINGEFFINGIGYDTAKNANGTFGMIKIDDVVFIPTANGFQNVNTGELLQVVKDGTYTFTENLPIYAEGELYKTINVNIDVDSYYNNGYNQGKTDGINEQKGKLESISITENGTYDREDGYNHIEVNVPDLNGSYDEGYKQGQADAAANARVLNVTENGNYLSKFSDPIIPEIVTGVYADGNDFYNYAELNSKVFNTNIPATKDSRIEFWWKNDSGYKEYAAVIGGQTSNGYIFKFCEYSTNTYRIEYGNYIVGNLFYHNFTNDMTSRWNHIIFSKQDGLYVNDELICQVQGERWAENETIPNFWINSVSLEEIGRTANGYFGMIKINDVVIIPTADGFLNTNTGELLEVKKDGTYTFTENLPIYAEGELYKTINVNIVPKVNVKGIGLKFGYSNFEEVPEWADFEGITDMNNMFSFCGRLKTIPFIDTSNVTNMNSMFYYCSNLQTIPFIDTSNVTDMGRMFYSCDIKTIPPINTSNVKNISDMFYSCFSLTSLPALDARSVNRLGSYEGIFGYSDLSKLTDFGGFLNLKSSLESNYCFSKLPNLTKESCINILNGLYDFTGNGETPNSDQGKLKVHQNFLDKVGDEISIGTAKGWTITA